MTRKDEVQDSKYRRGVRGTEGWGEAWVDVRPSWVPVYIVLKIWTKKRVMQNPIMRTCHEFRIMTVPLLCTWGPRLPPVKRWGYMMNSQFTEATAWKANRRVKKVISLQSGKHSIKARNEAFHFTPNGRAKAQTFDNTKYWRKRRSTRWLIHCRGITNWLLCRAMWHYLV